MNENTVLQFFPRDIHTYRIVAMGANLISWLGQWTNKEPVKNEVTVGINLVPAWCPHAVTHGIAMDDIRDDAKLGHKSYVAKLLSVKHVPMIVSTIYPECSKNFLEYPIAEVMTTVEKLSDNVVASSLWCNTLVYALALGIFLHVKKGKRGPKRFEIYGVTHRMPEGDRLPKNWRDYHGKRMLFEPGADELGFLIGLARGRFGIETYICPGDTLLGRDRIPMLHGYANGRAKV